MILKIRWFDDMNNETSNRCEARANKCFANAQQRARGSVELCKVFRLPWQQRWNTNRSLAGRSYPTVIEQFFLGPQQRKRIQNNWCMRSHKLILIMSSRRARELHLGCSAAGIRRMKKFFFLRPMKLLCYRFIDFPRCSRNFGVSQLRKKSSRSAHGSREANTRKPINLQWKLNHNK